MIDNVAVSVSEATAQPISILPSENSFSTKVMTPAITEASKPNRNPPSATISTVRSTYRSGRVTPAGRPNRVR